MFTLDDFSSSEPFYVSGRFSLFLQGLECRPPCSPAERALTHALRSCADDSSFL